MKPRTLQREQARPHPAMTLRCWRPTPGALLQALTSAHSQLMVLPPWMEEADREGGADGVQPGFPALKTVQA